MKLKLKTSPSETVETQDELVKRIPQDSIAVNEIFYSIQGEGRHAGVPMVFVRLNVCHVGCKFCDTKYTWQTISHNKFYDSNSLLEAIKKLSLRCPHVCITGGEPLEQAEVLYKICKHLSANRLKVHLETSGSMLIPKEFDEVCHWIVCSPKKFFPPNFEAPIDEVKVLVTANQDLSKVRNFISKFRNKVWVSIQPIEPDPPVFGNPDGLTEPELIAYWDDVKEIRVREETIWLANRQKALDICKSTGWMLSPQMHKYFNIR